MPRYGKKFKDEWKFFIRPETGNVTYNPQCVVCVYDCKQSYKCQIVACRSFKKKD
ncbi:hypothetical protein FACS1894211_08490 [Clostridia bacterium]|nr:hypothetical protein FACS1894211_08490 [Clostridia bacterium]